MIPRGLDERLYETAMEWHEDNVCPDCYKYDEDEVPCGDFHLGEDWVCNNYRCVSDVLDDIEHDDDNRYDIDEQTVLRRMRSE